LYLQFQQDQTIVSLGCHPKHIVHEGCFAELKGFFQANAACPLCRVVIDEKKIEKK
jgi:hypothetical protein